MPVNKKKLKKAKNARTKNWKEYFLEFFMLFLAVSLGFLADNLREKTSENVKEREYIVSMIEDAEADKLNIKNAITSNNIRVQHLDSLSALCIDYRPSSDTKIYKHYMYGLIHPDFITPTERTIEQLKNAGAMRLIRNKTAVGKIILYDNYADKLVNQQEYYERYQNSSIDLAVQLFNFQLFGFSNTSAQMKNIRNSDENFDLISRDKLKLIEFGNVILVYQGVAKYYEAILREMNQQADDLIKTLKSEYDIE